MAMSPCGDYDTYSLLIIYKYRIDKYILSAVGNYDSCCRNVTLDGAAATCSLLVCGFV